MKPKEISGNAAGKGDRSTVRIAGCAKKRGAVGTQREGRWFKEGGFKVQGARRCLQGKRRTKVVGKSRWYSHGVALCLEVL
jgi:hypothetical protein